MRWMSLLQEPGDSAQHLAAILRGAEFLLSVAPLQVDC
jgi:hypothetical protein